MHIHVPQTVQGLKTATVRRWLKQVGQPAKAGEVLVELETEDALIQLQAPADGVLTAIAGAGGAGKTLTAGAELGSFSTGSAPAVQTTASALVVPPSGGTAAPANSTPILMPQAGNTMEEGTLLKWRVKVGDSVAVGQVICEVETDKATVEVEATAAGKIAWLAAEGSAIPVKQPIAIFGDAAGFAVPPSGGSTTAPAAEKLPPKGGTPSAAVAVTPTMPPKGGTTSQGRVKASPAARKLAAEKGLDLAAVGAGSGPEGRILSTDLVNAKAPPKGGTTNMPPNGGTPSGASNIAAAGPMGQLSGGRKALSKMRKAIAVNLQTSKQTVPHFYVKLTINADPLFTFYRAQKPATGCTLNDVMLLAVGRVVGEFAAFRSRLEGNDFVETPAANIGVAVSVPDGLVVPVVLNIHALTLGQLASEAKRVVESARNGKIENMGKGVFTISNMGMLGVEDFSAIINPPESGILAISGVREAVIVKDGAMRAGRVMSMTLSVDHRVVDGALAAQFMGRLRDLLENPEKLLG